MARIQHVIPNSLKEEAEMLLNAQGIPPRVATIMFYREVVANRGLPFKPSKVPNELTKITIEKADQGKDLVECKDADDMFNQLGI